MLYWIVLPVFIFDRFLKLLIVLNMEIGASFPLVSFMNITHLRNTGIAFSMLQGANTKLLWINSVVIIFLVLAYFFEKTNGWNKAAYAFILSGAISNIWDRIHYGSVIDYLDFKVWPVFNIADSSITVGGFILVFLIIKEIKFRKKDVSASS